MKNKNVLMLVVLPLLAILLFVSCAGEETVTPTPTPAPPAVLNVEMTPTGHWHVTRSKTLNFTVTDDAGNPVTGLSPTVTVKTLAGTVDEVSAVDNGDGSYSADYTAVYIGSGYSTGYSIAFSVEHEGTTYVDAWPADVVKNGNERIMPTIGGTLYAYQVRYGWDPGSIHASDEDTTMYFEPRRAIQEGDEINTEMPWRNSFNHILGLEPTVLVESVDGTVSQTLTPTYTGLGIYRAQRIFSEAEVGAGKEYTVSFLFTDPYNGFTIDKADTSYPLVVKASALKGAIQLSPLIPGHGEHWANPANLPMGPIYGVYQKKLIFVEYMWSEDMLQEMSMTLPTGEEELFEALGDLNLEVGYTIDHVEVTYMPHGHEAFEVAHYDLHMFLVPHEEHLGYR